MPSPLKYKVHQGLLLGLFLLLLLYFYYITKPISLRNSIIRSTVLLTFLVWLTVSLFIGFHVQHTELLREMQFTNLVIIMLVILGINFGHHFGLGYCTPSYLTLLLHIIII